MSNIGEILREYRISECFAYALVYSDESGLSDEQSHQLHQFEREQMRLNFYQYSVQLPTEDAESAEDTVSGVCAISGLHDPHLLMVRYYDAPNYIRSRPLAEEDLSI
jgi:hypothetical protein